MTFKDLIDAMNIRNDRKPGQWTPGACAVWRRVEPQDARLLEAMVAWELVQGRRAQPSDEDEVRQRLALMDEATAAVRAARAAV